MLNSTRVCYANHWKKVNSGSFIAENHCYTKVNTDNMKECSYLWTIEQFKSVHYKIREPLKSGTFSATNDDFKWYLELQFRQYTYKSYISLFLRPNCVNDVQRYGPIIGEFGFSIVKPNENVSISSHKEFIIKGGSSQEIGLVDFELINPEFEKNYLLQDKLTIFCSFTYMKNDNIYTTSTSLCSNHPNSRQISESNLSRDLEQLLNNEHCSDVTLSIEGKDYPAHKNILTVRSSVFSAMFRNDMLESTSNRIVITDIDQKPFEAMLYFIYTGKTKNLDELAFELLQAADKYDLKELRFMCEETLSRKLSTENVIEILILADAYHAEQLKAQAFQFIKFHASGKNLENTEIWNVLTTSHPHLMKELLAAFLK